MKNEPPENGECPRVEAADDAFTRWFIETMGSRPTPAERKKFYVPVMEELGWSEADHDRSVGDLLITPDRDGGIEPLDADDMIKDAQRAGIDLSGDPDLHYLLSVSQEARARRAQRKPRSDPRKALRALTKKLEKQSRRKRRQEEVAFRGSRTASRKSRERWRRDEKRDQRIIEEIQGFFKVEVGVRMASTMAVLVGLQSASPTPGVSEAAMVFPHWEKSSEVLRAFAMAAGAGAEGARDFTLHMNDAVLDYAVGGDGQSFARRMLRRITDALTSHFKRVGLQAPAVMFFVEQAKGERPHLHGVVMVPDHPDALAIIREALKLAGGTPWKSTPTIDTQVDIGGLPEPVGWVTYITKFKEVTKSRLGSNIFAASQSMRVNGRDWYEGSRSRGALLLPRKAVAL